MIGFFLQTSVDTVAQAVTNVADTNTTTVNEGISVFEFILKGGFFLIPIISFVQEALAAIHCQQAKVCG